MEPNLIFFKKRKSFLATGLLTLLVAVQLSIPGEASQQSVRSRPRKHVSNNLSSNYEDASLASAAGRSYVSKNQSASEGKRDDGHRSRSRTRSGSEEKSVVSRQSRSNGSRAGYSYGSYGSSPSQEHHRRPRSTSASPARSSTSSAALSFGSSPRSSSRSSSRSLSASPARPHHGLQRSGSSSSRQFSASPSRSRSRERNESSLGPYGHASLVSTAPKGRSNSRGHSLGRSMSVGSGASVSVSQGQYQPSRSEMRGHARSQSLGGEVKEVGFSPEMLNAINQGLVKSSSFNGRDNEFEFFTKEELQAMKRKETKNRLFRKLRSFVLGRGHSTKPSLFGGSSDDKTSYNSNGSPCCHRHRINC